MGRKLLVVLGNGFSMDLLSHLDQAGAVDARNLFRKGASVPWPADGDPGFLSSKHCPSLWALGARPQMPAEAALRLIEEVITCANVFASLDAAKQKARRSRSDDIYIFAYKELVLYLKHLFVYYDQCVGPLDGRVEAWSWASYLKRMYDSDRFESVTIVTYNYDVWLERVLIAKDIPFSVGPIQPELDQPSFRILKPHGSISFTHKTKRDRSAFEILKNHDLLDGAAADFDVAYDDLGANYLITPLIPPAGDSARFNHTWAGEIRREVRASAEAIQPDDEVILCGLSYWHVDRMELDEILTSLDPHSSLRMVNPGPVPELSAVLSSFFTNFISYPSSDILENLHP